MIFLLFFDTCRFSGAREYFGVISKSDSGEIKTQEMIFLLFFNTCCFSVAREHFGVISKSDFGKMKN